MSNKIYFLNSDKFKVVNLGKKYFDLGAKPKHDFYWDIEAIPKVEYKPTEAQQKMWSNPNKTIFYGGMKGGKTAMVKKLLEDGLDAADAKFEQLLYEGKPVTYGGTVPNSSLYYIPHDKPGTIGAITPSAESFWKSQQYPTAPTNLPLVEYLLDY